MVIQEIPRSERLFIGGDFNRHIGVDSSEYDSAHGGFGFGERNNGGVSVLDFVVAYELSVVNFFFKKKEDHLVIFKSGSVKTRIDYFLTRADSWRFCKDCKVIPSECIGSQHRLLVLDVKLKCSKWKKMRVGDPTIKWWTLTSENAMLLSEKITEEGAWRRVEDAGTMWKVMADCFRRSAKEVLGTSRRGGNRMKGAWWWNEEVKEKARDEKEPYADFLNSGADGEREVSRVR